MDLQLFFGVLAFFFGPAAGLTLFPVGRELIYRWEVSETVGTILPTELNETWGFHASVIVQQPNSNITVFKFNFDDSLKEGDQIKEQLSRPFQAMFNMGSLKKLFMDVSEEEWSINMKRAFASLLQLSLESIVTPFVTSFINKEDGMFGTCNVEYVITDSEDILTVRKVIDHNSCDRLPVEKYSTSPPSKCPKQYEDLVMSDSERFFTLTPKEEVLIRNITTTGRLLAQPYKAKAEAHYSKIRQSFQFQSMNPITQNIDIAENNKEMDLVFKPIKVDPTYGKKPANQSDAIEKIYNLIGELSDSLTYWEVGVKGLDNQTAFYILDLMWWINREGWEELYTTVTLGTSYRQETIQHFFWELVPKVGSHAAAIFIRDLILSNRVKGFLAAYLLVNFPFFLRNPTEELLLQCENLLNLDKDVSPEVKNAAVLSFASLIKKTCKLNCEAETIDRYAKTYLDKFTESPLYEDQMVYLHGLSNLELDQALDFLIPTIVGQQTSNTHIRFLATWATLHAAATNPEKVYEIYWPIFTNRSEPLELRASALTMLFISNPSSARFFSLYWYMQTEPSEQLYNYYYTTIHSVSNTNYPCYAYLGPVAAKIVRFVPPKSRQWATGNYILDFEDHLRDYGGILQALLIASEHSGLPKVFIFIAEQHSMGYSREYSLYLKTEGLDAVIGHALYNISGLKEGHKQITEVLELLRKIQVPLKHPENLHLEIIFKVDGMAVICQYMNQTSFSNLTSVIRQISSAYSEFSVNHQSLNFPSLLSVWGASDIGTTTLFQMRSTALTSARGSINQENGGRTRYAELDLRFSWNSYTSLRGYNPFNNTWHGADRCRNLHIRLPFETQLVLYIEESLIRVNTVRHRGFVLGSRLGLVWHAASRLVTRNKIQKIYPAISDEWTMDSEDLGGRVGASVFDCSHPNTLSESLHSLKGAFLANSKNYNMVPGGVVLLGLLSLKDQMQFLPLGSSCGVMLYFSPLLTQVEPVLLGKGNDWTLSMKRPDGILWEIKAGSKRLLDGNEEFTFKLYRTPSVSVSVANIWRVKQLEGAFIVPLRISGVFNLPAAITGYAFLSWGDAGPSSAEKFSVLDIKMIPGGNESRALFCRNYTPRCLQSASDLAARQTVVLQYANIPGWLKMAAHALFPEHIQTESTHTQVTFDYPVALSPWNTKGLCALNNDSVLTFDNATMPITLSECYSLAVADCSQKPEFSILVKKKANLLGVKIYCEKDVIDLLPSEDGSMNVTVNDEGIDINQEYLPRNDSCPLNIRLKDEGVTEVELQLGLVLQHFNTTVVTLIPARFRGFTCGMCGDFNGDTNNERTIPYVMCS